MKQTRNYQVKELLHPMKFFWAATFAAIFSIVGYYAPIIYLQYFDKTEYIRYTTPVTFNKKIYAPCEIQTAQSTFEIKVSSRINIKSRMYLVVKEKGVGDKYRVIKEYNIDTFLQKQKEIQIHVADMRLPCDLEDGVYFYRGVLSYEIKHITKFSDFYSDTFTISKEAGESAKTEDL